MTTVAATRLRFTLGAASLVLPLGLIGIVLLLGASRLAFGLPQLAICLAISIPAYIMAFADSPLVVPYVTGVWCFAPLLRRMSDFHIGSFQAFSLFSVLPLIATSALLIVILREGLVLPRRIRTALGLLTGALVFGLVIGVMHSGVAAVFDFLNYVGPLTVLLYFAARRMSPKEADLMFSLIVTVAVFVSLYGWIQFLLMTPWDAMWMGGAKMLSIGQPRPREVRVFSTMNSPGSLSSYLFVVCVLGMVERRWRGVFGWAGVLIVLSCLGLTMARSAWIAMMVGLLVYTLVDRSGNRFRTLLTIGVVFGVGSFLLPMLPGGSMISDRVASMGAGQDDVSYQDRTKFSAGIAQRVVASPFGSGLGSTGVGSKLQNQGELGELGDFDNGYLNLVFTFGILGGVAIVAALCVIGRRAFIPVAIQDSRFARLAIATIASALVALIFGNCLTGVAGFMVWLPLGPWLGLTTPRPSDPLPYPSP